MKIALLCPTRERMEKKTRLIESVENTADSLDNFVLYLGVDEDDPTLLETQDLIKGKDYIKLILIRNGGKNLGLGVIWNLMVKEVRDDIFAMIGDDMLFATQGWDTKILDEFDRKNCPADYMKMVHCNDGMRGPGNHFATMPPLAVNSFIHRKYYELTGRYVREEWKHGYHDTWINDVYSAINRKIYRHDIMIKHLHYSHPTEGKGKDKITERLIETYDGLDKHPTQEYGEMAPVRLEEIKMLQKHINENEKRFSILICSLNSRKEFLDRLRERLSPQINKWVEVLVSIDDGQKTIGQKRNELLKNAKGNYIAFVDDDDLVSEDYVEKILDVTNTNPDVIGMHLLMTTDGENERRTWHSLKYNHWYDEDDPERPGKRMYFRNPNHLNPVKRELALKVGFPNISNGEDKVYSMNLLQHLTIGINIDEPIYYYMYRTDK